MAPRLAFGTDMADWQERISVERLRRERMARAQAVMRQHGVPSLLAARQENTRYLSGLRGPEFFGQLWYVLFFAEADPVVFAHAGFLQNYPAQAPWIREWRLARAWLEGIGGADVAAEEAGTFAREVVAELQARGLVGEPLAVAGFDAVAVEALRAAGLRVQEGGSLMQEARTVKTADEINCLKMAEAIGDVAWWRVKEVLRPGIREGLVVRQAVEAALEAGAEQVPPMNLRSGPTTWDRGVDRTNRIIQAGDLVYGAFCGITFLGYRTCYYRTFMVGREPTAQERQWHRNLVDRLDAVIAEIRPGGTTAEAARHFPAASTWGYRDEAEVLTMEIGHGIGLAQYEPPVVNRQWSLSHPQVFEPGMVIAVEGREGAPGVGGVRMEDMVVVTERGAELIDHFPRDEITVAGV